MDSHEEDGEIRDERYRFNDDDEFSVSSYEGDQGDSLDIKPPQAIVPRREKKERKEKRDRHRRKGDRHKERHRLREHRDHNERRREHRLRRERDLERREARHHERHSERPSKRDRSGDARVKIERERHKHARPNEYYVDEHGQYEHVDDRTQYERVIYKERSHPAYITEEQHGALKLQMLYKDKPDEKVTTITLSPKEKTERDRRMERFLLAEKQKELSQRDADVRRQRREEERKEAKIEKRKRMSSAAKLERKHRHHSPFSQQTKKAKHHHTLSAHDQAEVHVISEDEMSPVPMRDKLFSPKPPAVGDVSGDSDMDDAEQGETPTDDKDGAGDGSEESGSESDSSDSGDSDSDSESSSSDSDEEGEDEEVEEEEEEDEDQTEEKVEDKNERCESASRSPSVSPKVKKEEDGELSARSNATSTMDKDEVKSSPESLAEVKVTLPNYYPAIMGCRSVDEFECLNRIEEGTYGVVYRAREKATSEIVALKRLKMEKEKEGFPITSLREVNTLLKAQHENIVTVREIVVGSNVDIYIVMDYVEHDLKSLMETMRQKKQSFTIGEIKTLMIQLLKAVHHLHDNWILHRDLKTSNLLLSHRGILKVGDFGLAREYGSPIKSYTPIVVTLWYRAPELLLGVKIYSCPIDVWSVGCIFGELLGMEPMFPGKSEIDQLNKIFKDLGTPSEKIWPGYKDLPVVKKTKFADYPYNHLRERYKSKLSDQGFLLLTRFLTYNPAKRITCIDALKHDYFCKEHPAPIDPAMFPTWPAKSENPHSRTRKSGLSPKPPSGGKNFKDLGDGEDENIAARGFFLTGIVQSGPGFTLK